MVGKGRADKMPLEDGTTYTGPLRNGKPEGQGTSYHHNGHEAYEGEWLCGHKHGTGTSYYDNGKKKYEGQWESGQWQQGKVYSCIS